MSNGGMHPLMEEIIKPFAPKKFCPCGKEMFKDGHYCDACLEKVSNDPFAPTDPVNRPSHYTSGKIEVIAFIEDQGLGFHRGNCVKYVCRAGKKEPTKEIEDLRKAIWYLEREVNRLECK